MLASCSAYSTPKIEVVCSSETMVDFQRTARNISMKMVLFITTTARILNPTNYDFSNTEITNTKPLNIMHVNILLKLPYK
jgi:L-cystine uptake protein TcyP (sodium:dicarboxylate symporter family)